MESDRNRDRWLTPRLPSWARVWALLLGMTMGLSSLISASVGETRVFRLNSRAGFLEGTLDGIGVDELGTLRLADRVERLAEVDEPFLLSAASHPEGWVIGTGNSGRVLLVTFEGEVQTLYSAAEPEIFAVWADDDGTVFAGSSPNGKVYRIRGGETSAFFDPGRPISGMWRLLATVICSSPPAPRANCSRSPERAPVRSFSTVKIRICEP